MNHPSEYIKMEYLNNIAKTKAKISGLLKLEIDKEIEEYSRRCKKCFDTEKKKYPKK